MKKKLYDVVVVVVVDVVFGGAVQNILFITLDFSMKYECTARMYVQKK